MSELFRDMSCFMCIVQCSKKEISLLRLPRKSVFLFFLFVAHLNARIISEEGGDEDFQKNWLPHYQNNIPLHIHRHWHLQERRYCLSHWITIWMFDLSTEALYCSQNVLHNVAPETNPQKLDI